MDILNRLRALYRRAPDPEISALKHRNEALLEALEVFMPITFDDIYVLSNLPDDEVVKIRVTGERLKKAIAIWEAER